MNTWQKVDEIVKELKLLTDRMDNSKDMFYLKSYELKDMDDEKVDAINVTSNKPATFANAIISDLTQATWQTVVEGNISEKDAHIIEQFIDNNLEQIDEYLIEKQGLPGLHEWLSNHVCVRGPIGAEFYPVISKDSYKVHCFPFDMRWTPFRRGSEGLDCYATISFRSRDDLITEYPKFVNKIPTGQEIEVRNYWDSKVNELWIAGNKVDEQNNPFETPPAIIVFPTAGFLMRDKGYMKYEGEDLLFMVRDIIKEWNRTLTIEQSLIFNVLRPPMEYEEDNPTAEPNVPPPRTGETLGRPKGGLHKPVPTGDMNTANLKASQDIYRHLEEGAPTSPRVYTQAPSGAELLSEMEALARLQNSRQIALKVFREQFSRMIIDQFRVLAKGSYNIGSRGRRQTYSVVSLKDPESYNISCKLMTKNKRQELANLAMFTAAYDRLPLRYNLSEVLMADDPDGIINELEIEQSKKADPAIDLFEKARRYARQAEKTDDDVEARALESVSKMLTERVCKIIEQRAQPEENALTQQTRSPETKEPAGSGQALTSLLGQSGLGGQMPKTNMEEL